MDERAGRAIAAENGLQVASTAAVAAAVIHVVSPPTRAVTGTRPMNVTMNVVNAERTHAGMSDPFIDVIDWSCKMRQARTQ
jgi:hypothetical protein